MAGFLSWRIISHSEISLDAGAGIHDTLHEAETLIRIKEIVDGIPATREESTEQPSDDAQIAAVESRNAAPSDLADHVLALHREFANSFASRTIDV